MYATRPAGLAGPEAGGIAAGAVTGAAAGAMLGPIGAAVGAVVGAAAAAIQGGAAAKAAKKAQDAEDQRVALAIIQAKRDRATQQAMGYTVSADQEQGSLTRWVLYGTGGALLAGAGVLWIISRKTNPRRC